MNDQQNELSRAGANLTDIWLKGSAALCDLQAETARNLFRIQAQNAAVFGAPDLSKLFGGGNGSAQRLFTDTAEQMSKYTRQATELTEMQCQLSKTFMEQANVATENMRSGMEQIERSSRQGLEQVRKMADNTTNEVRHLQQAAQQAREQGGQDRSQQFSGQPGQGGQGGQSGPSSPQPGSSTKSPSK